MPVRARPGRRDPSTIRRRIGNDQVERALREMALFLEMDDVPFKPAAYRRAAYGVAALDRPLAELYEKGGPKALRECPGVGEGIAERIVEMLELGREYIVITDHTRDLGMACGLDHAGLRKQKEEIRRVDRELEGIRVLAGAEANIRADGSLDVDDDVLSELDVVGAAVRSHFEQPRSDFTRRLVRAIENPHVDVLFHPMARALGRRKPVAADFDEIIEACVSTGTILEIDSQPERLDLSDFLVRRAVEAGARIAIDSDAHTPDELRCIDLYGVGVARRGWVPPHRVVNTLGADELLASLRR